MNNLFVIIAFIFLSHENTSTKMETLLDNVYKTPFEEITEVNTNSDVIRNVLYKGTLNGTIKISLYLKEQEQPCGGDRTILSAMYKYDNQDKWILLDATTDKEKKNYCMVEDNFSGALFLEENKNQFKGFWISPNTKKQFKVELENQLLDIKFAKDHTVIEQLEDILEELYYYKNDC